MKQWQQSIILSLGGSLIVPNGGIDTSFLKEFNDFIRRHIQISRRFFIITGGGGTCRNYQQAAQAVVDVPNEDLDWLGIHATRLNAHLIRTIFRDIARPQIIESYDEIQDIGNYSLIIGSGWKPGWSTDYDTVMMCKFYGAKTIVNMSNTDGVYTADPRKDPQAKRIDRMSWKEYRVMFGDKWVPGFSSPIDPIAAKLSDELGLTIITLAGKDLRNVEKAIEGKDFIGTTIEK
ncbi:aspartate kinase [Candidatus Roizmanbacteria bacterium RIFCSPLOWO2_01_FULL_40_14]|uniref:Uridylate kinase n=3 Tax=Candidatus Roizmaniibacteriota TaxID=1752723 RepID=A0A0G0X9M2_9BACT|nr:MAG: Aspartate/glutamate/uridylate kinase [Candidatus Roizmanbacteria bacterium GW2011_GWB1_40_7]KKS21684.1 MAG: Aspartate/glutamate/uridylate kinase [Candidatus Roizmanbacteria bacterium GW2011_GWC2_41_7]OGK49549.1 MAG: aspartate kinase [Candidatus Roizmanbacteria bacterium RIFCSPLOWO2_01_FULL_40_14]